MLKNPRTKHVSMPRFVDRVNNNLVERLNGTRAHKKSIRRLGNDIPTTLTFYFVNLSWSNHSLLLGIMLFNGGSSKVEFEVADKGRGPRAVKVKPISE